MIQSNYFPRLSKVTKPLVPLLEEWYLPRYTCHVILPRSKWQVKRGSAAYIMFPARRVQKCRIVARGNVEVSLSMRLLRQIR